MAGKKPSKPDSAFMDKVNDFIRVIYDDLKRDVISHVPKIKKRIEKRLRLAAHKIQGQKISLIGPPAVGKTSLLKVLRNPQIEKQELENYKKTGAGEEFTSFTVNWTVPVDDNIQIPYQFKVSAGLDNGGEDYIREGHWLEAIRSSRVILYMFDFERFQNPKLRQQELDRIRMDFDWIGEHVNVFPANFAIIPIANKVDLLCTSLAEFDALQIEQRDAMQTLRTLILASIPKGYRNNIRLPILMSLFDKRIRNEQFAALMLAFIGDDLVNLIKECASFETQGDEDEEAK